MIVNQLYTRYQHRSRFFGPEELYPDLAETEEKLIWGSTLMLADRVREAWGQPLRCSSGVRTQARQEDLIAAGQRAATYSPHVIGRTAMDLDVDTADEVRRLRELILKIGQDLGLPVRVGWRGYLAEGKTFCHMDLAPMLAVVLFRAHAIPQNVLVSWSTVLEW